MLKLNRILVASFILVSTMTYAKTKGFIPTVDPNSFYGFKNPAECPFKDQSPLVLAKSPSKEGLTPNVNNNGGKGTL